MRAPVLRYFCMLVFSLAVLCRAQGQGQELASLGDFQLQSGQSIKDCKIGYRTFGTLNPQRSNVVIWPTWFLGRSEDLAANIGPGKVVDSTKFFVIAIDALGDGVSSSPSNSASQPRMSFPKFTIRDMVSTQHELLSRKLGLNHIYAVVGQSMGGFQAFEWMVDFPLYMDKVIAVMGSPRIEASDLLWTSVEAEAIQSDKDWNHGNYAHEPNLAAARYMHLFVMETPVELNKNIQAGDAEEAFRKNSNFGGRWDANDWLYQILAVQSMNIYGGDPIGLTAAKVRCKTLIINGTQDLAVNATSAIEFAHALGVSPLLLTGACGHLAVSCEAGKMTPAIQKFLD